MNESSTGGESGLQRPSVSFLTRFVATGFFSGYVPGASGTVGTLVGLLLYWIPGFDHPFLLPVLILAGLAAGVVTAGRMAEVEGRSLSRIATAAKEMFQPGRQKHADPSIVVVDEIVGMWVALLWLPKALTVSVLAFILFRVFDIVKPPPAASLEGWRGGWGIMADDVVAGIYANLACRAALMAATAAGLSLP